MFNGSIIIISVTPTIGTIITSLLVPLVSLLLLSWSLLLLWKYTLYTYMYIHVYIYIYHIYSLLPDPRLPIAYCLLAKASTSLATGLASSSPSFAACTQWQFWRFWVRMQACLIYEESVSYASNDQIIYIYIFIYTYIYIYIKNIYMYIYVYIYICTGMYIYMLCVYISLAHWYIFSVVSLARDAFG